MPQLTITRLLGGLLCLSLVLTGCAQPATTPPSPAASPTVAAPTITPTLLVPRTLNICLGQEPSTLYAYGGSSRAMWSVLEAVYDGPFDTRQYAVQPVILQKLPSVADGDAVYEPIPVQAGDLVVDVGGSLVALAAGVTVLPARCTTSDCAVTWDGTTALEMDHLKVTFQLLDGLLWSDGQPLTAQDSVYSYNLSADPATPTVKTIINRTAAYEALDDLTAQWTGVPGYFPQRFETLFWLPMPEHANAGKTPTQLVEDGAARALPLGWGAYILSEWVANDHITLQKNPNYFRAAEGLPKFDTLTFRFLGEAADNNLAALLTGECDVVDQTSLLDEQLELVTELEQAGKLQAVVVQGPEWEGLNFGIKPAAYDDGYNPWNGGDRPDFFSDVRTRQAFAYCLDRQALVDELFFGQSSVPATYLPPGHPLNSTDLAALPHDTAQGIALLEAVGWKELDGDPATPRVAVGVVNVPDGTRLAVNYATTNAAMRVQTALMLAASLAECGIQVNVQYSDPDQLFAYGASGPLFGRQFDLAQFGWQVGSQPYCQAYQSDQIPTAANGWLTVNITGYSNPTYDASCLAARSVRPDDATYVEKQQAVASLFSSELPVIPLYFRLKIAAARPDFCGLEADPTARSGLWNIENFDYGAGCDSG